MPKVTISGKFEVDPNCDEMRDFEQNKTVVRAYFTALMGTFRTAESIGGFLSTITTLPANPTCRGATNKTSFSKTITPRRSILRRILHSHLYAIYHRLFYF